MSLIQKFIHTLRVVLTTGTAAEADERFLSDAIDHADLERRIASQSRAQMMAPLNIGR